MSNFNSVGKIFITAVAAVIGAMAANYGFKLSHKSFDVNSELKKASEKINATLPVAIDTETRLDSTIGDDGTFTYNYTLINYSYEDLDKDLIQRTMEPKLLNNYCTSADMKQFLDFKVAVIFLYFDKNGRKVIKFKYDPSNCHL